MPIELLVRGVLVKDGYILLVRNIPKAHLFLPGGHIEFAEPARSALTREMHEEIGMNVTVGRFIGAAEHFWKDTQGMHAELNLVFAMTYEEADCQHPPVSREEQITFAWFPLTDLTRINFQPEILRDRLPEWITRTSNTGWASSYAP